MEKGRERRKREGNCVQMVDDETDLEWKAEEWIDQSGVRSLLRKNFDLTMAVDVTIVDQNDLKSDHQMYLNRSLIVRTEELAPVPASLIPGPGP